MSRIRGRADLPENTYEVYTLPLSKLPIYDPQHALLEDWGDSSVVNYHPLQKVGDDTWLINVHGRVYSVEEDILEEGLTQVASDHNTSSSVDSSAESEPEAE